MGSHSSALCVTMFQNLIILIFFHLVILPSASADSVQTVRTHTHLCLDCGMIEGTGYLTLQICGDRSCCLSRSLDNDISTGSQDRPTRSLDPKTCWSAPIMRLDRDHSP